MHRVRSEIRQQATAALVSVRVKDACRFTGISRITLYLLIKGGEIEIIKLGATTLVVTEILNRYVESKRLAVVTA